jgi:hypothetical protein
MTGDHICRSQLVCKIVLIVMIVVWLVGELVLDGKQLSGMDTICRHIVKVDNYRRWIFMLLFLVVAATFIDGYLWRPLCCKIIPSYSLVCFGVFFLLCVVFFVDLFMNYSSQKNIRLQFQRYHNTLMLFVILFLIVLVLFDGVFVPGKKKDVVPKWVCTLIKVVIGVSCVIFLGMTFFGFPGDDPKVDFSGYWYGFIEWIMLFLLFLLFPVFCHVC